MGNELIGVAVERNRELFEAGEANEFFRRMVKQLSNQEQQKTIINDLHELEKSFNDLKSNFGTFSNNASFEEE